MSRTRTDACPTPAELTRPPRRLAGALTFALLAACGGDASGDLPIEGTPDPDANTGADGSLDSGANPDPDGQGGTPDVDGAEPDAGPPDVGGPDADAGPPDADGPDADAGPPDADGPDADAADGDAAPTDAGADDSGGTDAGETTDTGASDGETGDAETADTGGSTTDTGGGDAGSVDPLPTPDTTVLGYAGGAQSERFNAILPLSDGTLLIGGMARSLDWIDVGVPRIAFADPAIDDGSTGNIALLLHVSADLSEILHVAHFPAGTVRDVARIRSTEIPGEPTGAIYISGSRDAASSSTDGYYIARLNGNFVDGEPTGFDWVREVRARPRTAGGGAGESHYKTWQPWDVGSDGRVYYGLGAEYDFDWAAIQALDATGADMVVEHWPVHWSSVGEHRHVAASSLATPALRSGIVLKAGRGGSLRSHSQADFDAVLPDGNGRTDRRGRWPDDIFYSGPCLDNGNTCSRGPGHTGYRTSDKPTQRLGGIVIDRRTNDLYFGYSTQSVLPDGLPDFEPAVVAMAADGQLRWWSRLYPETGVSTPDQYVDGLVWDYSSRSVVVLARSHGNNTVTLWPGNAIAARPGATAFQNQFTGTSGNIHISWLGRFDGLTGTLQAATWVAEPAEGTSDRVRVFGEDVPLFAGQPNPNAGWPDLNTTRCRPQLSIDGEGRVAIACTGRRTITTANAWQRMPALGAGTGSWNEFVRVYAPDFSTVEYSTLVTGAWDTSTGVGGGNTTLQAVLLTDSGVYTVGWHALTDTGTVAGVPIPTTALRTWMDGTPTLEDGIVGFFRW